MKNRKKEAEEANSKMDEIFNGEDNDESIHIVPLLSDNTRLAIIEEEEE
ncbi:hypothetical protein [Bacillus sp. JJ1562]